MKLSKTALRALWKDQRSKISSARRKEALLNSQSTLLPLLQSARYVLSYASMGSEFDTAELNLFLASQAKLILPKIAEAQLKLYQVKDLTQDLEKSSLPILEPRPHCLEWTDFGQIDLALIPGLAFDSLGYRLGYGKGFYDRLLPLLSKTQTLGLGLKEQLSSSSLQFDAWDYPVKNVYLF